MRGVRCSFHLMRVLDLPEKLAIEGGSEALLDTCKRRFFFCPAFEIYNGVAGLYDYGPVLTAIKSNTMALWRSHFIIEESMVEIETTAMTPEEVFVSSGHVERFNDVMTKDVKTGECIRLDKYLEDWCTARLDDPKSKLNEVQRRRLMELRVRADGMSEREMAEAVAEFQIKSPKNNDLAAPFRFNLMFESHIGPDGAKRGYLRPELAQGIFMNFKRMLEFNNGRMPFAGATTGTAFRNEIAPRGGLMRLREFQLAEVEHFVNPAFKDHPKFDRVRDLELPLFPRDLQEQCEKPVWMTIGEAVETGIIDNQTLGYFIGRVFHFLKLLGAKFVRFRQHRSKEMAHYAKDCWDAELLTAAGWLECVGIADRSCFDLEVHSRATGTDLSAFELFPEPREEEVLERKLDSSLIGRTFKKDAASVMKFLQEADSESCLGLESTLEEKGFAEIPLGAGNLRIERAMVKFRLTTKKISGRNFIPSVIEPSFGVGRILWSVLEQNYYLRPAEEAASKDKSKPTKGEKRASFSIPARIAPYKVAVCPLMVKEALMPHIYEIAGIFSEAGISYRIDDTGVAIGRRYSRTDELGVPFCVTVDFTTNEDQTVTVRERDSCTQVRVPKTELAQRVQELSNDRMTWDQMKHRYPEHTAAAAEKVGKE
eukprot:NODE_288_length_2520_cov_94.125860_g265_i0.p1 GENE.NODE_288_length_2520_cov_94.125860_g265_i0~~NODE_288_length_2520_cov_94.125860_g265_i0.p1  ORF type:complete len:653 (-),score=139.37 NODE_288_length_2520_cov_94.125860_g265_i0:128-2086(-)